MRLGQGHRKASVTDWQRSHHKEHRLGPIVIRKGLALQNDLALFTFTFPPSPSPLFLGCLSSYGCSLRWLWLWLQNCRVCLRFSDLLKPGVLGWSRLLRIADLFLGLSR